MKKIILIFLLCTVYSIAQQSNTINIVPTTTGVSCGKVQAAIAAGTPFHELLIYAVDSNATSTSLPPWFGDLTDDLEEFFEKATFNKLDYSITILTKNDEAFRFAYGDTVTWNGSCSHVHSYRNIQSVIESADSIIDFKDYDYDNNDKVYIHFLSSGPRSGGYGGTCWSFLTNDFGTSGNIRVYIKAQSRGSSFTVLRSVIAHESGHDLFNFRDMDHSGLDYFEHYSLGGFDVMASGGFQGVPSLYNPCLRDDEDWFTPETITPFHTNIELKDFQKDSLCYIYEPTSLSSDAVSNQKFYVSYHKAIDVDDNKFYHTWPLDNTTNDGLLIWHKQSGYSYSDWRKVPIDIEAAHGKYNWVEDTDSVHNTYEENPLTGRDSMEIRKTIPIYNFGTGGYDDTEIQGPYYGKDHGSASVFYTPDVSQDFTAFTNPNSNFIVNSSTESYAQNIVSGFSVRNLRTVNNKVYVDFAINDFTVSENTTLAKGKWRIENDITVASGITLTIQEGTDLSFKNGAQLIVSGILDVNGTSTEKVVFDFLTQSSTTQNGIRINNGASVNIEHAIIKNAYRGIFVAEDLELTNSEIKDCYTGLYQYCSDDVDVSNTNIHNNRYGAYLYNSGGNFSENIFATNVIAGVECVSSSSPNFAPGDYPIQSTGYNQFNSNDVGVITTNSYPELGRESCLHLGGNNSFTNSDIAEMEIGGTSMIYAEKNYWGTSTPTLDLFLGATSSNFSY